MFRIQPTNIVGSSLESNVSILSKVSTSTEDCQKLHYGINLPNQVVNPQDSVVLNLDKIPINGIVLSSSILGSGGSSGAGTLSSIDDDSITCTAYLGRDISSSSSSPGSQIIVENLPYKEFIQGQFKPSTPYHPFSEIFRSVPIASRFLNIEINNNGTSAVTLTNERINIDLNFVQADSNNRTADGYPSGGVTIGPEPGFPELPIPGEPTPPPPPSPDPIKPVTGLNVVAHPLEKTSPDYEKKYKPVFLWTIPQPDKDFKDIYMNWILYQKNKDGIFSKIQSFNYKPLSSSTPLGTLNPWTAININESYRIQIEIIVHQDNYPSQSSSSFLIFSKDPYPPSPPPVINPPSKPLNLEGTGGDEEVELSWDVPTDSGGALITGYVVEQSSSGTSGTFSSVATPTDTKVKIDNLSPNTKYYFRVAAKNSVGTGEFTDSIEVSTEPNQTPPDPPTDLTVTGLVGEISLTWKKPGNNGGSLITGYNIERAADNNGNPGTFTSLVTGITELSYLNKGIDGVKTYWYKVCAVNSVNPSVFTAAKSGTTKSSATKPDPPNLKSVSPGVNELLATWIKPTNNGGASITKYNVQYSGTSETTGFSAPPNSPVDSNITSLKISDLEAKKNYWIRVNAVNSIGASDWSNVKMGTTSDACGNCDACSTGTTENWNGKAQPSQPMPPVTGAGFRDDEAFGAKIFWEATPQMKYRNCVDHWELVIQDEQSNPVDTYSGSITAPVDLYITHSGAGDHGKDFTAFLAPHILADTKYTLVCTPIPKDITPMRKNIPVLTIPFTTGTPVTPPSTNCEENAKTGSISSWNGTITPIPVNGVDSSNPNNVGCTITWSHDGLKYIKCIASWTLTIKDPITTDELWKLAYGSDPSPIPLKFIIRNYTASDSNLSDPKMPTKVVVITELDASKKYQFIISPTRKQTGTQPPSLTKTFSMGHPAPPTPVPPVPPKPDSGNLPQTYVTTYGIPSWGTTDMVSYLSQSFYSNGKTLAIKDQITTDYNQHQSWSMVRNWAQAFFSKYITFIDNNPEITNAMILIGDWLPILPGSGLPIQPSTLTATSGDKYGQVAGSKLDWNIEKANYSYCAPNGPVDFGLSYNPNNTLAPPPSGIPSWWDDDPEMIGCPLILDFLLPLARNLKGKGPNGTDRIVEISVNGDVSKNGNDGAYGSLDCGNYTAADQRLDPSSPEQAILECILGPEQIWTPSSAKITGHWGPIGKYKTQQVWIDINQTDYNTFIGSKTSIIVSQNNTKSTTGTIIMEDSKKPVYYKDTNIAMFWVKILMTEDSKGKRQDGGFTITDTSSVATKGTDAKLYFGKQDDLLGPNDVQQFTVLKTDPSIGIFLRNWIVQQSAKQTGNTAQFPSSNKILSEDKLDEGGIIGQITTTGPESWGQYDGSAKVQINVAPGITTALIKTLLQTAPDEKPKYNTTPETDPNGIPDYSHRIYPVPDNWDPASGALPAPPTDEMKLFPIRIGNIGTIPQSLLPAIYNYGTVKLSATPTVSVGKTRRALGTGANNDTTGAGGWLPSDWETQQGNTHYPAYWNVYPNKYLPIQPNNNPEVIDSFGSPGSLIMGGGNIFIGNGIGECTGRGSYFDPNSVTKSTERPSLITLDGTGTGKKGTFYNSNTFARVGFPLDNLHQSYLLIYRINQKIMEFNYKHSSKNNYNGPDVDVVIPLISHVHHDKESYQVNKNPQYPECDATTGEIKTEWLLLGNTVEQINNMSGKEYAVWKQSRRQTSVAYEKYLYNRYMPAEYLPDWRTGTAGKSYYLPHNTDCFIPHTGDRSQDGLSQTGGEKLWDTTNKPWNVNQQRNFGVDPASTATSSGTNTGIGNYSNDFRSRSENDQFDGIQRYNMGWVNYAVTAWAYGTPPGQTIKITTANTISTSIPANTWVLQTTTNATGKVASTVSTGTELNIITFQGIFSGSYPLQIFTTDPQNINISSCETGKMKFTSQGTNEAYQELYNIGEVKPPVTQIWSYDPSTTDKTTGKPRVPVPNITVNTSVNLAEYVNGTITGDVSTDDTTDSKSCKINSIYNTSSIVLDGSNGLVFPKMFKVGTVVELKKDGTDNNPVSATITAVTAPVLNQRFPPEFVTVVDDATPYDYGTGDYVLPAKNSTKSIPNGLGSCCIPGGATPTCPQAEIGAKAAFCPLITTTTTPPEKVGPYYRLNAVTNTLISRIYNKYGVAATWPFLGTNSVNASGSSPALTDLWLRYDAINTGVIPLDGRGFEQNNDATRRGPQDEDGTFAPFAPPYVSSAGKIDLTTLYGTGATKSNLDGNNIIEGSDAEFKPPKGPRQAIALFANEYIGGALTLDPESRPGTATSEWLSVTTRDNWKIDKKYVPITVPSWVGSRGMEVVVYADLCNNKMNKAFLKTDGGVEPPFSKSNWKTIIQTNDPVAQSVFMNTGHSFAANSWGGEYNGLSSLQDNKLGYKVMQDFLKSCASMMTGPSDEQLKKARVGLYTIGFIPETWLKGPAL